MRHIPAKLTNNVRPNLFVKIPREISQTECEGHLTILHDVIPHRPAQLMTVLETFPKRARQATSYLQWLSTHSLEREQIPVEILGRVAELSSSGHGMTFLVRKRKETSFRLSSLNLLNNDKDLVRGMCEAIVNKESFQDFLPVINTMCGKERPSESVHHFKSRVQTC